MMNKPKRDNLDYRYGVFAKINKPYGGPSSMYWTNNNIKDWCDKNDVYYESTDKRADLIERIKKAGFR
jgi:hypothetical protein